MLQPEVQSATSAFSHPLQFSHSLDGKFMLKRLYGFNKCMWSAGNGRQFSSPVSFCLQVSAYSSPFAQQPHTEEQFSGEQGQDEVQHLLRSPSQLPSTAPSTSDVRLNVIPEHEPTNEDAATGPSATQQPIQQVVMSICTCLKVLTIPNHLS